MLDLKPPFLTARTLFCVFTPPLGVRVGGGVVSVRPSLVVYGEGTTGLLSDSSLPPTVYGIQYMGFGVSVEAHE